MIKYLLILLLFIPSISWGQTNSNSAQLLIEEQNGTNSGRYRVLKVSNGTSTNNGDGSISVTTGSGGSGSPGGSNTNVQYNSSGSFAGNSGFVYDGQNVGIGTVNPIGLLDINANLSSLPPLVIDTQLGGSFLGSPIPGAVENDGNFLVFTPSTARYQLAEWPDIQANSNSYYLAGSGNLSSTSSTNYGFGQNALSNITSGTGNLALGSAALSGLTSSNNNVALGIDAGEFIVSSSNANVFIGQNSGTGLSAGGTLTSISTSVLLGFSTTAKSNGDSNEVVIGSSSKGNGSNTTTIGNSSTLLTIIPSGNLGIGSITPGQKLDVTGTVRMTGFALTSSPSSGKVLTSDASGNGTWSTPSGGGSPGGSSPQLQYNNSGSFGGVSGSGVVGGNVGIGTSAPIYPLEIHNNISGGSLWTQLNLDNTADYISGFNLSSAGNAVWGVYRYGSGNNNSFCIGQNNISEPVCVTQPTSGNGLTVGLGGNGVSENSGISSGGNIQTNDDLLAGVSADENSGYYGGDSFIESSQSWQGSNITLLNLTSQDSINTTGNNPWGMAFKVDADGNDNPMTTISSSQFGVVTLPLWLDEQGSPVLIGGNPPTWDTISTLQVQGITSLDDGLILTDNSGNLVTQGLLTAAFQLNSSPTSGYVLTSDASGNGTWHAPSVGTVTSIVAGSGLTGGTITTSGTIALDLTHANTWTGQQIFNTANVGIGSITPGQKLDVTGTVRATAFIKTGGTSSQFLKADGSVDSSAYITGNQAITLSGDATGSGTTAITTTLKNTGTAGTYRSTTFDAQGRETSGTNPTTFSGYGISDTSANLASALTDETGTGVAVFNNHPNFIANIGIGTTNAGQALDVQGTVRILNGIVTVGPPVSGDNLAIPFFVHGNSSITESYTVPSITPQRVGFFTDNGSLGGFSLESDTGGGAYIRAGVVNTGYIGFATRTTISGNQDFERMRVANNGNVGIGSTNPGQALDVKGTVRMTGFNLLTSPTNGYVLSSDGFGNGTWTYPSGSGSEQTISYQPGLLSAVNSTIGVYGKFAKTSTVDNIIGSAVTFSCLANPTITMDECGTSTTCASPTAIGTVTVTAAGTAFSGTVSNPTITAGDYVGWAITAGTCASIDISGTAQIHAN